MKIDDQKEEVIVLRHVILSHHGLLEYGSPVRPKIMEAEIIHMIDNLDAEMMMMTTALGLIGPGEMTNKNLRHGKSFPSINRISTSKNRDKYGNDSAKNKIIRKKRPSVNQNVRFFRFLWYNDRKNYMVRK